MSSTNKTTHYELPQFVENDIFNPLVDDNDAYDKIDTALYNIADAEADDAAEIVGIKSRLDTAEGKVEALETQNGTDVLTTVAQTLSGAVNELKSGEDSLDGRLDVVEDDINNVSTGLKAKVTALENQNGDTELTTTAQTLSGAVNELDAKIGKESLPAELADDSVIEAISVNYANSKFAGQRYGSMLLESAQSVIYDDGKFYVAGTDYETSFFINIVDAESMTVITKHTYAYNCHPNSMFKVGNYLWIVDSDFHVIYKISMSDMAIAQTITSITDVPMNSVVGGSEWDGKIYLFNGNVYVINEELEFIERIELENPNAPAGVNPQAIFVYDGYIYRIYNNPNILAIYNMDGKFIATKDIGNGNDRYPYGEVETLFIMNGSIYMNSVYIANPSIGFTLMQIFETNLIKPIMRDGRDGYAVADGGIIYIDNTGTHHRNPNGSQTNPFENLFEGCLMFNYLEGINNEYRRLRVIGTFTDEVGVFANCDVNISGTLGEIRAYNSTVTFVFASNVKKLLAEDSRITSFRANFVDVDCKRCTVSLNGGEISNSISFNNCLVENDYCLKSALEDDVSFNDGFQPIVCNVKKGSQVFDDTHPIPVDGYTNKVVNGRYLNTYTTMKMTFNWSNGCSGDVNIYIPANIKASIMNGTPYVKNASVLIHDGTAPLIANVEISLSKTEIALNTISYQRLDGTAVTLSDVTITVYKVDFINKLVN